MRPPVASGRPGYPSRVEPPPSSQKPRLAGAFHSAAAEAVPRQIANIQTTMMVPSVASPLMVQPAAYAVSSSGFQCAGSVRTIALRQSMGLLRAVLPCGDNAGGGMQVPLARHLPKAMTGGLPHHEQLIVAGGTN